MSNCHIVEITCTVSYCISFLIDFVLENSAGPNEMLQYAELHLGLQCLLGFPVTKGLIEDYVCIQM